MRVSPTLALRGDPQRPVVVTHPVHQHAYETALAAQEADLLRVFVTGIYDVGRGVFHPRLRSPLPASVRGRIENQLRRRRYAALDAERIQPLPARHSLAYVARPVLNRVRANATPWLESAAHRSWDRAVAKRIREAAPTPQLIHVFESCGLATLGAGRERGSKTLLDVPIAYEYARQSFIDEARRWGPDAARGLPIDERQLARIRAEREAAEHLFVPSEFVRRCLRENGVPDEKMILLPYGVDPDRFHPQPRPDRQDRFRAIFVGQLNARKGLPYLLEAFRQLGPTFGELVLVGRPDTFGQRLLREYEGVHRWLGHVPKHDVEQLLLGSDVFVFPTLAEGSSLATYEAMAMGMPIITTLNSGSVARDGKEGLIVEPCGVESLKEALVTLAEDRERARAMGERARQRILDGFTWAHYRRRLAQIYRDLL